MSDGAAPLKQKICLLGTFAVGKTSLVAREVQGVFRETYLTTVGVKIDKHDVVAGGRAVTLIIWDLNGEDAFQTVRDSYLRGSAGYLLVADGTRAESLDAALALDARARGLLGDVPRTLLVNKADLRADWELTAARLDPVQSAGCPVQLTSARTGEGVAEAFADLAARLVEARA